MASTTPKLGAADWHGSQMTDDSGWRLSLDTTHRAEVLAALGAAQTAGVRLEGIPRNRSRYQGSAPCRVDLFATSRTVAASRSLTECPSTG